MFRSLQRVSCSLHSAAVQGLRRPAIATVGVRLAHGKKESDEEFDARYVKFFSNPKIDGWDIRQGMNDLQGHDLIPEPKIIIEALKACRRNNDYALSVRYLEALQDKCASRKKEIWPYILQEIQPTLTELGVLTPEEMGYDKPELALQDVMDM